MWQRILTFEASIFAKNRGKSKRNGSYLKKQIKLLKNLCYKSSNLKETLTMSGSVMLSSGNNPRCSIPKKLFFREASLKNIFVSCILYFVNML